MEQIGTITQTFEDQSTRSIDFQPQEGHGYKILNPSVKAEKGDKVEIKIGPGFPPIKNITVLEHNA
ncbi:MAG: hypothetical protein AAF182_00455 [Pseudomonadota bacterium]